MPARRVIDAVLALTGGPPLQATELRGQAPIVQQLDAAGVNQRQKVVVQIRLPPRRLLEDTTVPLEPGNGPLASVAVAANGGNLIAVQDARAFRYRYVRVERCADFMQAVEN